MYSLPICSFPFKSAGPFTCLFHVFPCCFLFGQSGLLERWGVVFYCSLYSSPTKTLCAIKPLMNACDQRGHLINFSSVGPNEQNYIATDKFLAMPR